ncbi:MAG TPA: hypothetical protein VLB47_11325, partial [Solirubrobacteraceae bacterium]|nr:hypothetical protein [Solirubrobacteraceae bacterium]
MSFVVVQPLVPQLAVLGVLDGVDVGPPGHEVRIDWGAVPGATTAEVAEEARLEIAPVTTYPALGALPVAQAGDAVDVTLPSGGRIHALTLTGLKLAGGGELRSSADLDADPGTPRLRLAISAVAGGQVTPLCVVPALGGRGVLPAPLTGASFSARVLTLPDPAAARLRLQLVRGNRPEELEGQPTRLDGASGTAALPSGGLTLTAPDGSAPWALPGELPGGGQVVGLGTPAALALRAALQAGGRADVSFRLAGAAGMRARATAAGLHGALVRAAAAVAPPDLEGEPVALVLDGGPLASEAPSAAVADLTLTYAGIRLHDVVRDPPPAAAGGVGGPGVGAAAVVRALPPATLAGPPIARAAPVGRAPDGCALSVQLVDLSAGPPGTPLGDPGTVELPPSAALSAPWVRLPEVAASALPAGVAVRATSGRFLWAAAQDGTPLLRLAVRDPDPGGRPVRLGTATLALVTAPELQARAHVLPAAALRGPAPPLLSSDLFCTLRL